MNQKFAAAKKFVSDHKVAITAVVTATVTTVAVGSLVVRNQKIVNEFLEAHDLLDEFYAIED